MGRLGRHWRLGAILALALPVQADEVRLAVASNFAAPMALLEIAFEQTSGHQVRTSFGASGALYAQVLNGAPFDVFLSADQAKVDALIDQQQGLIDSRFTYAVGALVLWSSQANLVDENLDVLTAGRFQRLAIANPELAPYGKAALETLQSLGIYQEVQPKLVMGENISQAYQFVSSGNAQIGLVALAQVVGNSAAPEGSFWIVQRDFYAPILQDAVVLARGEGNPAAWEFVQFLRSPAAAEIIRAHGYLLLASE